MWVMDWRRLHSMLDGACCELCAYVREIGRRACDVRACVYDKGSYLVMLLQRPCAPKTRTEQHTLIDNAQPEGPDATGRL